MSRLECEGRITYATVPCHVPKYIADQMADVLEYVVADMNDSMPIPSDVILRATKALEIYRKAKGD